MNCNSEVSGDKYYKLTQTFPHTHSSKKDMNEYRELTDSHETELFYTVVVHTALMWGLSIMLELWLYVL
jgi:hypothetical protein